MAEDLLAMLVIEPADGPPRRLNLRDGEITEFELRRGEWRGVGVEAADWELRMAPADSDTGTDA